MLGHDIDQISSKVCLSLTDLIILIESSQFDQTSIPISIRQFYNEPSSDTSKAEFCIPNNESLQLEQHNMALYNKLCKLEEQTIEQNKKLQQLDEQNDKLDGKLYQLEERMKLSIDKTDRIIKHVDDILLQSKKRINELKQLEEQTIKFFNECLHKINI